MSDLSFQVFKTDHFNIVPKVCRAITESLQEKTV